MKKNGIFTILALVMVICLSSPAMAFNFGDVFAGNGNGQVNRYDASGTFIQTLTTGRGGQATGMAFDAAGNLYVTNWTDNSISRFAGDGTLLGLWGSGYSSHPESIVFNALGEVYVGQADSGRDILHLDAAGNLLNSYNVATEIRGSDWIDLAADQKTMFYTSEDYNIKRYDVSTGTQLADFANLGDRPAFALRILANGDVLVANTVNVKRLNAAGTIIQTYDAVDQNAWFALTMDPGGSSFWSGDYNTGMAYQFDLASGAVLNSFLAGVAGISGLAVYGEVTQGGGGAIPEPTTMLLFGIGMAGLGIIRRKRS